MGSRVDISAEYIRHTDMAVRIFDGSAEEWVPFSQVVIRDDNGRPVKSFIPRRCYTFNMPEWLAREKGFI